LGQSGVKPAKLLRTSNVIVQPTRTRIKLGCVQRSQACFTPACCRGEQLTPQQPALSATAAPTQAASRRVLWDATLACVFPNQRAGGLPGGYNPAICGAAVPGCILANWAPSLVANHWGLLRHLLKILS
jgi:hypothetical protein